jgi:hypothetical protein
MATKKTERVIRIAVTAALILTLGFSALAFSYLRNPSSDEPWSTRDAGDRGPEAALNEIGAVLAGSRGRFVKNQAPDTRTESHQLHFVWRGKPLVVRVMPDPSDPLRGRLVWDTPDGPKTICRGVRPGGFRAMDTADDWILKLEVVRMDPDGNPTELWATKTVTKKKS